MQAMRCSRVRLCDAFGSEQGRAVLLSGRLWRGDLQQVPCRHI